MKKLLLVFILPFISGCIFSGYGIQYDSGVWLRFEKENTVVEATLNSECEKEIENIIKALMEE